MKPRIKDKLAGAQGSNFIPRSSAILHDRTNAKSIVDIALQRSDGCLVLGPLNLQQIHPDWDVVLRSLSRLKIYTVMNATVLLEFLTKMT